MITDKSKVIVIDNEGKQITLQQWQLKYGLPTDGTKISKHFDMTEDRFQQDINLYGFVVINEILFRVLDQFREDVGRPLKLNALNRNQAHQNELKEQGFRTASISPHLVKVDRNGISGGCAADIDTDTHEQTNAEVLILARSAIKLGYKIRIGWKQYQIANPPTAPNGYTFIHCDVCPEYYAKGKPWESLQSPSPWRIEARW